MENYKYIISITTHVYTMHAFYKNPKLHGFMLMAHATLTSLNGYYNEHIGSAVQS